jgi:hypothetical protein
MSNKARETLIKLGCRKKKNEIIHPSVGKIYHLRFHGISPAARREVVWTGLIADVVGG